MRSNNMLSQKKQVLEHLKDRKSITSWEAIERYHATRLSAIIYDLKDDGHTIVSTRETDGKKWWAKYTLLEVVNNG